MGPKSIFAVIVLAIAALLLYFMSYIVEEGQQAVITQFGAPVNFVTDPGLKFRVPFIQSVQKLEKRLLPWDGAPENMQTGDTKRIFVDCWARWHIVDLETFFTNVRTEQQGQKILDDIVDSSVRDVIAQHNLIDLVRSSKDRELVYDSEELSRNASAQDVVTTGRKLIEDAILADASDNLKARYGMELVAVKIKRVSFDDRTKESVFVRMRSERELVAKKFESEAREEGNKIVGETKKELDVIECEMQQRSAEIRGSADAEVIKLTAEAYGRNAEFFEFLQRLEMYKMALKKDTSLILSTNSDMFRLFKTTGSGASGPAANSAAGKQNVQGVQDTPSVDQGVRDAPSIEVQPAPVVVPTQPPPVVPVLEDPAQTMSEADAG